MYDPICLIIVPMMSVAKSPKAMRTMTVDKKPV